MAPTVQGSTRRNQGGARGQRAQSTRTTGPAITIGSGGPGLPVGGIVLVSLGSLLIYSSLTKTSPVGALKTILSGQKPAPIPDVQPAGGASTGGVPNGAGSSGPDVASAKAYARSRLAAYGWSDAEWPALEQLWNHESGWRATAQNPSSTAFGIPQFLDSTWAGTGIGKTSDPARQIDAGLVYIKNRYTTPTRAWAFWQANHWY